jgi:large subunit ribosomal protein L4e
MTARPLISVFNGESGEVEEQIALPGIFSCPVRHDVVNFVHYNMAKKQKTTICCFKNGRTSNFC